MDEKMMILGRVLYTLDQIEVRGKQNMDKLLGCIQGVEHLKELLEQEKAVTADGNGD